MPNESQLQWIELADFRAGIDINLSDDPCTASPTNTFSCEASPQGQLKPLWKQDYTLTYDALPDGTLGGSYAYHITGFFAIPCISDFTLPRLHEFWIGVEWVDGTDREFDLRRYRTFDATWDTVLASHVNSNVPTTQQFVNMNAIATRANRATPTDPGTPVVIINYTAPDGSDRTLWQFPDEASPGTTAVDVLFTTTLEPLSRMIAHQGRIVFAARTQYSHGADGIWLTNENIFFTTPNDTDTLESATASQYAPENPSGYAIMASMSANELFMVKRVGGGVAVTGDLSSPTVINYPMIPAAIPCVPAVTPFGVVYLGRSGGVYLWAGADTAEPIGRQLEDYCWQVSTSGLLEYSNILCMLGTDYLVLPRGWIFSFKTGTWWRLEDEANLRQHLWAFQEGFADTGGYLYGCTSSFTTTGQVIVYGWDTRTPASSFSWQSHPLLPTREKLVMVREVIVEALGVGNVTVTLTARDGTTSAQTFAFNSTTNPTKVRQDYRVYGDNIICRIQSAHTSTGAAPTVLRVSIGYRPEITVAAS